MGFRCVLRTVERERTVFLHQLFGRSYCGVVGESF